VQTWGFFYEPNQPNPAKFAEMMEPFWRCWRLHSRNENESVIQSGVMQIMMLFQRNQKMEYGYALILMGLVIGHALGLILQAPYLGVGLGLSLGGALGLDLLWRHKTWPISLSMAAMLVVVLLGGLALSDWYLGLLTGVSVGSLCVALLLGWYIWEQRRVSGIWQGLMALGSFGLLGFYTLKLVLFTLGY
jgi:hypothetical protein